MFIKGCGTGKYKDFKIAGRGGGGGELKIRGRWCVPNVRNLRKRIIEEAHTTPYSIHAGRDKMYKDLKRNFWNRETKA